MRWPASQAIVSLAAFLFQVSVLAWNDSANQDQSAEAENISQCSQRTRGTIDSIQSLHRECMQATKAVLSENVDWDSYLNQNSSAVTTRLDQSFRKLVRGLPQDQLNALRDYSSFSFGRINHALRARAGIESVSKTICKLDSIIEQNQIGRIPMLLFRGHSHLSEGADKPGYVITENAFSSTSVSLRVAERYAGRKDGVNASGRTSVVDIIDFRNQAVPGIWLDPISRWGERRAQEYAKFREHEVLLRRNLQFKVAATRMSNGTLYRILELERDAKNDPLPVESCATARKPPSEAVRP